MTFSIRVEPLGRSFGAEPGEAILAAAIRQGVGLPYGCRDGACGSCKCRLLEGAIEPRPQQAAALTPAEAAEGFILACCSVARSHLVLESRQASVDMAFPIRKLPARVLGLERRSADVMVLRLRLPAESPLQYRPGQYVDVALGNGSRRSYSIANAPVNGPHLELHVRHMPGGAFTDHVFGAMKEREIVHVEGPYGSFFLRDASTAPIVLLASGTGFAPIRAVLEDLQQRGSARPVVLYWGGRRPHDLYQREWVEARLADMPTLRFIPVISDAEHEDGWTGRTGFVHRAVVDDHPDLSAHQVYVCGAPIVVESARADLVAACGLPPDAFFADALTTARDKLPVEPG